MRSLPPFSSKCFKHQYTFLEMQCTGIIYWAADTHSDTSTLSTDRQKQEQKEKKTDRPSKSTYPPCKKAHKQPRTPPPKHKPYTKTQILHAEVSIMRSLPHFSTRCYTTSMWPFCDAIPRHEATSSRQSLRHKHTQDWSWQTLHEKRTKRKPKMLTKNSQPKAPDLPYRHKPHRQRQGDPSPNTRQKQRKPTKSPRSTLPGKSIHAHKRVLSFSVSITRSSPPLFTRSFTTSKCPSWGAMSRHDWPSCK